MIVSENNCDELRWLEKIIVKIIVMKIIVKIFVMS